jgi:hypothetical protein
MHFAAEDYGRHQLMNWGFVPLYAAVRDDPESHDPTQRSMNEGVSRH